jgi:hypothetical protein
VLKAPCQVDPLVDFPDLCQPALALKHGLGYERDGIENLWNWSPEFKNTFVFEV